MATILLRFFINIPLSIKIKNLDKTIPYLVHCQSGGRSMKAFKLMQSLGFKRVYHLDGGMLAWKKLGKTIQE